MARLSLWVFIAALPIFLFTFNVRLAINSSWLYSYGFARYSVGQKLGLSQEELSWVTEALITYFNSGKYLLGDFFNEREKIHLKDVRRLIQLDYRVGEICGVYLALFGAVALLRRRLKLLGKALYYGGLATLILFALLSLAVLVGFDRIFLIFHLVSFPNTFWILDPRQDRLILLFPQGFFFQATLLVVAGTVTQSLLLWWVGRKLSRRYHSW